MKVALNILGEDPGQPTGALQYYQHLAAALAELAPQDTFYLLLSKRLADHFLWADPNLQPVIFPYSNEARVGRVLTEHLVVPRTLSRLGVDVLNSGNVAPAFVPCALVATVKTMHAFVTPGSLTWSTRAYRRVLGGRSVRRAEVVIANSRSNAEDIVRFFRIPNEKVRIVSEAVDHGRFKPSSDPPGNLHALRGWGIRRPFVLFVSSLWRYKNAETLIAAFGRVAQRIPTHDLVVVGYPRDKAYTESLHRLVDESGLQDRVKFVGGVPHPETARLYQCASVFVYPSLYETFGLTILEAMACGCPVVTSDSSSMPEVAGGAAVLFPPKDAERLADALVGILRDPERRQALTDAGLRRAADFSWRRTAEQTYAAYCDALRLRGERRGGKRGASNRAPDA
ncbi:MAG: glycosyltransferase family 1 protein [Anaerolineales bacterium]